MMHKVRDLVSVLICTYNRKALLERAIDSAIQQQDCDLEIIVVDDCSSDGTYNFLKGHYGDSIQLLSTGTNSGRAIGSNLAFRHASGNFIALLDDDDYWVDRWKLKKQIDIMKINPSVGVLGSWWIELTENNIQVEKKPTSPQKRYFMIERLLIGGGVVSGSTPLISRNAWEKVRGMDINQLRGIDSDLYRRIALAGFRVDVLPEITTVADARHDHIRMSNAIRPGDLMKHIRANQYVLRKHWRVYLFFPRALLIRLRSIIIWRFRFIINQMTP